jgi:aminomethyltransferase
LKVFQLNVCDLFYRVDATRLLTNHITSEGDKVFADQSHIGTITSGMTSPTLGTNIAMGYVRPALLGKRMEVEVKVQDRLQKAMLTSMPFVKPRYWRG